MMLFDILITVILMFGLGASLRGGRGLIANRPYNNRYNDASGARQDHLG